MSCVPFCQLYCDTTSGQVLSKCLKRSGAACESGCICDGKARFKTEDGTCVSSCSVAKKPVTKDEDISRSKCLVSFLKRTTMYFKTWIVTCTCCFYVYIEVPAKNWDKSKLFEQYLLVYSLCWIEITLGCVSIYNWNQLINSISRPKEVFFA